MMPAKALDLIAVIHEAGGEYSPDLHVTVTVDYCSFDAAQKVARQVADHMECIPVRHTDENQTECYRLRGPHIDVEIGWL